MTSPVLIRQSDLKNAAKVAKDQGCVIEIRAGNTTYTIRPDDKKPVDGKPPINL